MHYNKKVTYKGVSFKSNFSNRVLKYIRGGNIHLYIYPKGDPIPCFICEYVLKESN